MTVCSANYSPVEEAYEFLNPALQTKPQRTVAKKPCDSYSADFSEDIASYANNYQDNSGLFNKTNFQNQNQINRELQNPRKPQNFQVITQEKPRTQPQNKSQKIYEIEEDESFIRKEYPNNRPDDFESSYDFQPSMINTKEKCPDMAVHVENINTNDNHSNYTNNNNNNSRYDYDEDTVLKMLSKKYMNEFTTLPNHTTASIAIPPPNYIDLILYIISGVILIFIMEQFVKIGTYLG
jgi:hypothetical protein